MGDTTSAARPHLPSLLALAALLIGIHIATNGQYGFHRDELQILDDGRHLAWGYPTYPPLTPFIEWLSFHLFGPSLVGLRLFSAIGQGLVLILTGLITAELGGRTTAQIVAALAVAVAPVSLFSGTEFQYTSFDYLFWVAAAYGVVRLLARDTDRLAGPIIGLAAGLGLLTKYAMLFWVAAIVGGLLLTPARRHLARAPFWQAVAIAAILVLPNLVWQVQHQFASLDFLRHIHERDVALGRTRAFLMDQIRFCTASYTVPLWVAGLVCVMISAKLRPYRTIGWMYLIVFCLLFVAKGRGYYLAPAYPMLFAAGSTTLELFLSGRRPWLSRLAWVTTFFALAASGFFAGRMILPILPIDDPNNIAIQQNGALREEIGWTDLVDAIAAVRDTLPLPERDAVGILAGNYGEAGAIDLYGPAHGLPPVICGTNAYWLRGYPDPQPTVLIVVGCSRQYLEENFESVELAGNNTNPHHIDNEESKDHPDIFICRRLRRPWPDFWRDFHSYG